MDSLAADRNLLTHFTWIQEHVAGMEVIREPDLVLTVSGLPSDNFNAVCAARFAEGAAAERIAQVRHWFEARRIPFGWWVFLGDRPVDLGDHLVRAGFRLVERETAMALVLDAGGPAAAASVESTRERADGPAIRVERVTTEAGIAAFARVSSLGYQPSDPTAEAFYRRGSVALLRADSPCRFYLGSIGEEPVGGIQVTLGPPRVAGLYNLVTLPRYRRRGVATALVRFALAEARRDGAEQALLQTGPAQQPWFERLGFVPFGTIAEYHPKTSEGGSP